MATAAQIDANRRNATRSTGPRTEAGKARSSGNATRHGFFSRDIAVILPEVDVEERETRRMRLHLQWGPGDGAEAMLVDRLAEIRDELARAGRLEDDYLAGRARGAIQETAARREEEADGLGRRLLLDDDAEGTPAAVLRGRLEATAEGCRWRLECLRRLAGLLEAGMACDGPDRAAFGRLLGDPQSEGLDGRRIGREIERLEGLLADREAEWSREAAGVAAMAACEVGSGFDRFLRYKSGLRREESKTIDQLIRLRKGGVAPARRGEVERELRHEDALYSEVPEQELPGAGTSEPASATGAVAEAEESRLGTSAVAASVHEPAESEARADSGSTLGWGGMGPHDRATAGRDAGPACIPVGASEDEVARRKGRPDPSRMARAHRRDQARGRLARAS